MSAPRVFLTGGDGNGWALDENLKLTRRALEHIVDFSDLEHCEVVHSVWWEGLLAIPAERLVGRRIICHLPGEPYQHMGIPRHRNAIGIVGRWIAQTNQAARQMSNVGIHTRLIPFTIDVNTFHPLPREHPRVKAFLEEWGIPEKRYLIGSFQRDSEGHNLRQPKLRKGPDIFAEILDALLTLGLPVHAILAGPRRHWLRSQLTARGVPYTFVGQITDDDDYETHILTRESLNVLYNLIDLYLVSSRSEGGPQAILEAAASGSKIVSTRVDLAEDVLDQSCIFDSPVQAVTIIERDIKINGLSRFTERHYNRVQASHRPETVMPLFREAYKELKAIQPYRDNDGSLQRRIGARPRSHSALIPRLLGKVTRRKLRIGLWHNFFRPPYGGGNQFVMALRKWLHRQRNAVIENRLRHDIDVHLLNSVNFSQEQLLDYNGRDPLRVVHRIDGPIQLIRGFDQEKDDLCFQINSSLANATILQSAWSYQRIVELGYSPVNPTIIPNAADPDIFNSNGRIPFSPTRKVRLISTSWSDNPRKGGPILKWIEDHLDWSRFQYTFVGRASVSFKHIQHVPPVPSKELANILRQHDIYIAASQNDPCSNAVVEALSCGLPVLYFNDGGHPELVGFGGLPFEEVDEILPQLDVLVDHYQMFQRSIAEPQLHETAGKYLELLEEVADLSGNGG